jgi:prophage regulatory protein
MGVSDRWSDPLETLHSNSSDCEDYAIIKYAALLAAGVSKDAVDRQEPVLARTGLSRSTIYRKIAEGTFPTQIKISVNGTGWHESDISRWIADPVGWRPKREFDEVR